MPSYLTKETRVLVQGATGKQGSFHLAQMRRFGTQVVAGVTPGKDGQYVDGIRIYDSVAAALRKARADWSCLFVPAPHLKDAALEALAGGLNLAIITEHVPVHDTLAILADANRRGRTVLGPNCPGLAAPGACKIGIIPNENFAPGRIAIVSRSGTLTYEIILALTKAGLGQSTAVGIGGDPVIGLHFTDVLEQFEKDPDTDAIVLIGEIGGDLEERAAAWLGSRPHKPVVAYITGLTAPPGKTMGHAGAITSGSSGTAASKVAAFEKVGIPVAKLPSEIVSHVKQLLETIQKERIQPK